MTPIRRGASVAAIAASLIAPLEGLWLTAKPDRLAHNLPTVCYGMTSYDRPVEVGDKYTPAECMDFLRQGIPKYWDPIKKCVTVELTNHQWAALISASYNAGARAVCKSPMVRAFNRHDPNACDRFLGWYVTSAGEFRQGLANRRKIERRACLTKD